MTNRQAYVSDKLTHFTGRSLTTDPDRYSLLVQIIESGILKPDADFPDQVVGSGVTDVGGALCDDTAYMADVVCFCDIPASDYHIHMSKYSHFGAWVRQAVPDPARRQPSFLRGQEFVGTKASFCRVRSRRPMPRIRCVLAGKPDIAQSPVGSWHSE